DPVVHVLGDLHDLRVIEALIDDAVDVIGLLRAGRTGEHDQGHRDENPAHISDSPWAGSPLGGSPPIAAGSTPIYHVYRAARPPRDAADRIPGARHLPDTAPVPLAH